MSSSLPENGDDIPERSGPWIGPVETELLSRIGAERPPSVAEPLYAYVQDLVMRYEPDDESSWEQLKDALGIKDALLNGDTAPLAEHVAGTLVALKEARDGEMRVFARAMDEPGITNEKRNHLVTQRRDVLSTFDEKLARLRGVQQALLSGRVESDGTVQA